MPRGATARKDSQRGPGNTHCRGLTVLECLVAMAVLLVISVVATKLMVRARGVRDSLRLRTQALAIAQAELERLRTIPYSKLPPERHRIPDVFERTVGLAQTGVVQDSIRAVRADGRPLSGAFSVNESGETVTFSPSDIGTEVLVSYTYYARGTPDVLVPVQDGTKRQHDGVVVVVAGSFAAEDLGGPVTTDTGLKLLALTTKWLDQGKLKELSLTALRTQA